MRKSLLESTKEGRETDGRTEENCHGILLLLQAGGLGSLDGLGTALGFTLGGWRNPALLGLRLGAPQVSRKSRPDPWGSGRGQ